MRTEKVLSNAGVFTRDQHFFLACWFNMVHQYSLDSYRVRILNPASALAELEKVMALGNEEEKLAVLSETETIINSDPVLRSKNLAAATLQFSAQLAKKAQLSKEKANHSSSVFGYFSRELSAKIQAHYLEDAFQRLEQFLVRSEELPATEAERFAELQSLTGGLLSTLLRQGYCLESLYQIYAQVLVPRRIKPSYVFERKLTLAQTLLVQEPQDYVIVLAIDQVSKPDDMRVSIGSVTFSSAAPLALQASHAKHNYLDQIPRRIFASTEIRGCDSRSAGAAAFERVNNIVNLLRFEYENSHVQMPSEFAFAKKGDEAAGAKVYPIPMLVPNPPSLIDGVGVAEFIKSVEELVASAPFSEEGRDRIYSAFRLYRLGRDTNVVENKLLNWWTAVEYLARGSQSSGNIGASVQSALTPTLCLQYLPKHLAAARNILVDSGTVFDDAKGQPIALRALSYVELHGQLSDPTFQAKALDAVSANVYISEQLRLLFSDLTPQKFAVRLIAHEQRVRWQLGRIYRARCDIVHSAGRGANTALLCSNLEYYLKTSLHALLRSVRDIPTLSGPREFFDRQAHAYDQAVAELRQGSAAALVASLDA